MDHRGRRERLRQRIADEGLRAWISVDLSDIRYLTGFSGSNAVLVIGADAGDDLIATDGRYQDQVAQQCPDLPMLIDRATLAAVGERVSAWSIAVDDTVSAVAVKSLPPATRVEGSWIRDMRQVKDDDELEILGQACRATVTAFEQLASEITVGDTELAVARRLEQLFAEHGGEDRAFASIVASGPNSAIPHHEPTTKPLERGDLLVIDAGARVQGYCADMTRTFVVAADPLDWQVNVFEATFEAQRVSRQACRSDADCRDVWRVADEVIQGAGFAGRFTHGLGHGVGLDIHEAPMLGPRSTSRLRGAMAVTVEPGVYLPGRGGVRIEDTLAVTASGPMVLTEAPRDLRVVG